VNAGFPAGDWIDDPDRRHGIIREPVGGIRPYPLHHVDRLAALFAK